MTTPKLHGIKMNTSVNIELKFDSKVTNDDIIDKLKEFISDRSCYFYCVTVKNEGEDPKTSWDCSEL